MVGINKKIDIIFHHIAPWGKFSGTGFHNRSGNVFEELWSHPDVSRILFVYAGDFWLVASKDKREKKIMPYGRILGDLTQIDEKIYILENRKLFPFDYRFNFSNTLNDTVYAARVKEAARLIQMKQWVSWFYHPTLISNVVKSRQGPVIYDSIESIIGHTQYKLTKKDRLEENYRLLSRESDIIFCVAENMIKLLNQKFNRDPKRTYWIPNGVRYRDYRKKFPVIPEEFSKIPKPVVGYIGVINDYTDLNLLEYLVRNRPEYSFVLVGKVLGKTYVSSVKEYKNVHMIPFQTPDKMPAYIHNFDVCINIYKDNDIVNTGDSIKIYNYLASGKPIVSTNVQKIDRFKDLVYIADTPKEFLDYLDKAVKQENTIADQRVKTAAAFDWSIKVDQMLSVVKDFMKI